MLRIWLRLGLALKLAVAVLLLLLPGLSMADDLLTNPGLNNSDQYVDTGRVWRGINEKVAKGWVHYYVPSGTYAPEEDAPKLHWMSSKQFAVEVTHGLDYYREGNAAQVIWSSYDFDAGIYQQVNGLEVGRAYSFEMGVASYWRGSGFLPPVDGKIKKCTGIDPTGGVDPTAGTVIWDWENCDATDKTWPYLNMAATAQATTMTFFVRIQAPDNESPNHTDLNYVYIDDGRMAPAPTVNLVVPAASGPSVNLQWSGSPAPGWTLQGVEVQYKDKPGGAWQTIQDKHGTGTSYVLDGEIGHAYLVRARAWQTDGYEDLLGVWVAKEVLVGGAFTGYVRNNFGAAIAGAQVSLTGAQASTGADGFYALQPPQYGKTYALTASASGHKSPPPASASVPDAASLTSVLFTLKPMNDAIVNGDFEGSVSGWGGSGTGSASLSGAKAHSGSASLRVNGDVTLAQAVNVSNMHNPTLSFWIMPEGPEGSSFQVRLQGDANEVARTLSAAASDEWQHVWLPLRQASAYDGPLTVTFSFSEGQLFLDEVSLGDGPHTLFLPLILAS
jgi:hypothetical protein